MTSTNSRKPAAHLTRKQSLETVFELLPILPGGARSACELRWRRRNIPASRASIPSRVSAPPLEFYRTRQARRVSLNSLLVIAHVWIAEYGEESGGCPAGTFRRDEAIVTMTGRRSEVPSAGGVPRPTIWVSVEIWSLVARQRMNVKNSARSVCISQEL